MTRSRRFGVRARPARPARSKGLVAVAVEEGFGNTDALERWPDTGVALRCGELDLDRFRQADRRAATESTLLLCNGATRDIEDNWARYPHQSAGNATRAEGSIDDIDFDGDLMRTAAGGRSSPPEQATRPGLNGWLRP
ncbi:hypothetical protein [Dactylosporangium sp. NPDC048998]|uniref:hypothetical protein n=1 Tax=Dactylosporangium sp. NPDC048998 TaxID=3363976 RepID=UPI003717010E